MTQIREWSKVDANTFENQIKPLNQPAVLRGLVIDWPLVEHARQGNQELTQYLCGFDNKTPVYTVVGQPDIEGRFFYNDALDGVNHQQVQANFSATLQQICELPQAGAKHAVAIQAASVSDTLPGLEQENNLSLLGEQVAPTMWLGNQALVAPHFDVRDNIACVVAGQRKFTLFPPEQIANLYPGPMLSAPGGVPISMVDIRKPDLEKFPQFEVAMQASQVATLDPGDAIYIPMPWWHAVESLADLNVLINYWWGGLQGAGALSPNNALLLSLMTISQLEPQQRAAWQHFFDYLVFRNSSDPTAHLPPELNDVITNLSPQQQSYVRQLLMERLT
ncbi:MAG: cupin-like domain-containing protein [Gammaproteobacteria bacterium]|nr:cupin-like domain-containing protein [Gammaproteobacteria bacterium]